MDNSKLTKRQKQYRDKYDHILMEGQLMGFLNNFIIKSGGNLYSKEELLEASKTA